MRTIGFEEHFFTASHLQALRRHKGYPRLEPLPDGTEQLLRMPGSFQLMPRERMSRLLDIGAGRIAEMDRNGIDMQVLSMAGPGVEELDAATAASLARSVNDELADAVCAHPDRFAGLATVAYGDPEGAADELERAVTKLGLKGVKLNSHYRGEYLDHPRYRPLWARIEALGVPVMLHPKDPPPGMLALLEDYPGLTQAAWGFTIETSTHALRLIASGLFDEHPKLQIVLGHLGEGLPFWLARIDNHWVRSPGARIKRKPSDYFRSNFYVTSSGMFEAPQLECVLKLIPAERVMFAVDYPYESIERGIALLQSAALKPDEREKLCHANAERLLALEAGALA